ncbi:hypothetical protein [Streptomyces sp. SID13726]|uniref:hypothetical protein n=1 Tax=Streptomyces sp. SID13726 TaxID=2706058 RepID=UPI0013B94D3B|nr:hypothetical protein [Streptomyces sp. SID13726]NEB00590.1 hypothetical protein [Streptomyces sp. SID13726]
MSRILTADAAFLAGFEEPCEHLVPDPNDCPKCRLTEAEIRRLAVLLRSDTAPAAGAVSAAA